MYLSSRVPIRSTSTMVIFQKSHILTFLNHDLQRHDHRNGRMDHSFMAELLVLNHGRIPPSSSMDPGKQPSKIVPYQSSPNHTMLLSAFALLESVEAMYAFTRYDAPG